MTDALDVLVGIELRAVGLNHGDGHVGAVGCDTLQVGQQIVEREALLEFTFALSKTGNVTVLQLVTEHTDELAQRLYLFRHLQRVGTEGVYRQVCDFPDRSAQYADFILGRFGEADLLLCQLQGHLGNIDGVVAQTLKIA